MSSSFSESLSGIQNAFNLIYERCDRQFMQGCGSYLFDGQTYSYYSDMREKQELLFNLAKESDRALEIGTYMCHSALIMLSANPKLDITMVDIDPRYSVPASSVLKELFPDAKINLIIGDSLAVLDGLVTRGDQRFDLFHVDGHHTEEYVRKEFEMCKQLAKGSRLSVVVDDVDAYLGAIKSIAEVERAQLTLTSCHYRNGHLLIDG